MRLGLCLPGLCCCVAHGSVTFTAVSRSRVFDDGKDPRNLTWSRPIAGYTTHKPNQACKCPLLKIADTLERVLRASNLSVCLLVPFPCASTDGHSWRRKFVLGSTTALMVLPHGRSSPRREELFLAPHLDVS